MKALILAMARANAKRTDLQTRFEELTARHERLLASHDRLQEEAAELRANLVAAIRARSTKEPHG